MPTIPQEIAESTQALKDNTEIVQQFAQGTANIQIPTAGGTLRPLSYWQSWFQTELEAMAQPYVDQIEASTQAAAGSASAAAGSASNAAASAGTAATKAGEADNSATAAANSASTASGHAQTATTKASEASSSAATATAKAGEAATSASNAADSANSAMASKNAAATSAGNASSSATQASNAASAASSSETNASNAASNAATSEGNAASSASAAQTARQGAESAQSGAQSAKTAAEQARDQAQDIFRQFGDQYLGPFASDPTTDNSGNPLTEGDIYFNTTSETLKFYSGTAWVAPETVASNAASNAQASASAASSSATAAANSESAASGHASDALSYRNTASSHASAASTSASNANASASSAASSASNASASAGNAADSATAASSSATQAASSASSAAGSASTATTKAGEASTSANNAADSAGDALASKNAASTSATNAAGSASAAAGSASTASTKAGEASTSASNAETSAGSAGDSATAAAGSASTANNHRLAAATSASNASSSESAASGFATAAATSEQLSAQWAGEAENVEVKPGEYSAYHWMKKAQSAALQEVYWGDVLNKPARYPDAEKLNGKTFGSNTGDVMQVGAFGLGAFSAPLVTDFDAVVQTSIHRFELNPLNGPGESYGVVLTMVRAESRRTQIASNLSEKIWFRTESSNGWSAWRELYHTGNFDPSSKLDASSYTAADVLAKLLTVDGAGSGLDADTLDGLQASAFATAAQGAKADSAVQPDDVNQARLARHGNYYSGSMGVNVDDAPAGDFGLYSTGNPGTFPPGSSFWLIATQSQYSGAAKAQYAISYNGSGSSTLPNIAYRLQENGGNTWTPWVTLYHSGNFTPADKADKTYVDQQLGDKRDVTDTAFPRYDLASVSTTATLNLATSNIFRVAASTPRTLSFSNAPGANRAMTVVITITGNSAVTWPSGITWVDGDAAPELGDNETEVVLLWNGIKWTGRKAGAV